MPVRARAHRGDRLRPWLAACFAVLLVLSPFARPSVPVDPGGGPAKTPQALLAHDGAEGAPPAAGLRPAQPIAAGILSRLSLPETALGLPPIKAPPLRPAADQPRLALQAQTAHGGEPWLGVQRSSVGTARVPTGPPA